MGADNIYDEEMKLAVNNLLALTEKGTVMWECDEYLPASFMLRDELEDTSTDHITHMVTCSCQVPGRCFELEIDEHIEFDETESGLLGAKLSIFDEDENLLSQAEASMEEDTEDEYGFVPLCDAIFRRSGEWLKPDFFKYMDERSFYPQKGVTKKHREHPLCRLMERLMNERRIEDFHKMILDRPFREQLLSE